GLGTLPAGTTEDAPFSAGGSARGAVVSVVTNAAGSSLGGIVKGTGNSNALFWLINAGDGDLTLLSQSAGSAIANQFYTPGNASFVVRPRGRVQIRGSNGNGWEVFAP